MRKWFWMAIFAVILPVQANNANTDRIDTEGDDSAEQARILLEKMSSSTRNLNYDGVFVYIRGDQIDSVRIIHKVDEEGRELERLISLTGANREVIRDNQDVTCIYSDSQTVLVEKGRVDQLLSSNLPVLSSIARISAHYNLNIIGKDRVAGRETNIIGIMPRDEHRYVYRFWVDSETSLMLKSAVVTMQGQILETILFTGIDIPHEIPNNLMTPMNTADYSWHINEKTSDLDSQIESQWKVQWLPNGFSLESTNKQVFSGNNDEQPVEHIVYSDGLATVSLYIEKIEKGKKPMNGYISLGAVNAYAMSKEDYQITAVGELPAKTVHKIALSVIQQNSNL